MLISKILHGPGSLWKQPSFFAWAGREEGQLFSQAMAPVEAAAPLNNLVFFCSLNYFPVIKAIL